MKIQLRELLYIFSHFAGRIYEATRQNNPAAREKAKQDLKSKLELIGIDTSKIDWES